MATEGWGWILTDAQVVDAVVSGQAVPVGEALVLAFLRALDDRVADVAGRATTQGSVVRGSAQCPDAAGVGP